MPWQSERATVAGLMPCNDAPYRVLIVSALACEVAIEPKCNADRAVPVSLVYDHMSGISKSVENLGRRGLESRRQPSPVSDRQLADKAACTRALQDRLSEYSSIRALGKS
jgi:hypothetical protein